MKQALNTYDLAATVVLLGLLGLPAAIGQTNATGTAARLDEIGQPVTRSVSISTDMASTMQRQLREALAGQGYALNRQSLLNTVLVVLAEEASQANLGSLTEDLNIMCRIFDRTLARGGLRSDNRDIFTQFLISHDGRVWGDRLFGNFSSRTECLYVEGYGPLFMIGVDFPLVEAPAPRSAPEPNEPSVTVLVRSRQTMDPFARLSGEEYQEATRFLMLGQVLEHSPRTSLLVIGASVKDIEEFAAGTLSATKFEKRIQSVLY